MKNILLSFAFLLITMQVVAQTAQQVWAQQVLQQQIVFSTTDSTLWAMDAAMHVLHPNDTGEGGTLSLWDKSKYLMSTRLPANPLNKNVNKIYAQALKEAYAKMNVCFSDNKYQGNWKNIGPENVAGIQNQGMVTGIWVDPNNALNVILGTEGGGLFRSKIVSGQIEEWINITDKSIQIGTLSVESFAVNPFNNDEIWLTTKIPTGGPGALNNTANSYALGIYHTTDAGVTWTQDVSFPTAFVPLNEQPFIFGCKIKYVPYLVGSNSNEVMLLITVADHVLGKIANNPWIDYTPNGLTGIVANCIPTNIFRKSNELYDIEIPDDGAFKGNIIVCNGNDSYTSGQPHAGVWRIQFNTTTGNIIGSPITLIDCEFNGWQHNNTTNINENMNCYQIEYLGNGDFYMLADLGIKINNIEHCNAELSAWNLNNINAANGLIANRNVLVTDIITQTYFLNRMSVNRVNKNAVYLGCSFGWNPGIMAFKKNGLWNYNLMAGSNSGFHADTRCINIVHSDATAAGASDPGLNDILYWGNDGGISKTTMHQTINANNSSLSFTSENLNTKGLYIADMMDVDNADGRAITGSAFHDGWYNFLKSTNTWNGQIIGDGMNATIDKRFTTPTNYRMIYKANGAFDYLNNPGLGISYNSIKEPEAGDIRTLPMEFVKEILYVGVKKAWISEPMGYENTATSTWPTLHNTAITPILYKNELDKGAAYAVAFKMGKVGACTRAYHMLHGRGLNWRLATTINCDKWEEWVDITQTIVKNITLPDNNYTYTDMVLDPTNADRIFVSLGNVALTAAWTQADINRVFVSVDAGQNFTDMSTGLTALPVNCMVYQNGSDDIIYAGTDAGVYYWNKPTNCWIKMNNKMQNSIVTSLSIDYCNRKLIAGTYGRGIWESD
jgi:hypothetical protein